MSALLVPSLYAMSGVCAYAALHHGLAVMQRRVSQTHLLFAALCGAVMAYILVRAGAYQAQTVEALVALRKWEVVGVCLIYIIFPWFIAGFTGVRPRRFLIALSVLWSLILAANWILPYGAQFADLPTLTHFDLPWGERVVDLRVFQPSLVHKIALLAILAIMAFGVHACIDQYRRGLKTRARSLAWALGLFFSFILFNWAANWGLIDFIHLSEFGFLALVVMMDLEMMRESRNDKRRMRDVLDHLPVAICLKDLRGRFQLINRGFETLFHVDDDNLLGKTAYDTLPPELARRFHTDEKEAIETGKDVEREHVLDGSGTPHIYETHQFPLLRQDGNAYAVCGVYFDVTEARQKDEALHKFRQQIWHTDRVASTGAISASLAHEICQPLAAILNNAQAGLRFLDHDRVDLEEIREIFQDVVRDDKRAGTIINGLRAMLQQQETPYADVDLAQCIEEVLELLHSEVIRYDVDIERMLETHLTVRANKTQLQQVILNLTVNALEAMAEQPASERKLRIRVTRADGKAVVSFSDTGIGIAEDMLDRVFEGFYTTKPQGLGVGLEVCRSIMESHHGSIRAERNPDRGATFRFSLPLAGGDAAQAGTAGA
ncbi:MAG: ATP-binding protein [Thiobacillus sp.]|uniref:ATP-binding protein n=1 Tax=Thiobacillus sp. TaxID=924 RepID=UPI0027347526|nr:ATP-binding protein [Thiobacillus sp.]MDP3584773.1 ATP-binding protein [Thiobacillus sp.]